MLNLGMHLNICKRNWWYDRYYSTLHFDSTLYDLDFDSRPQGARKQELQCQRLGLMNLVLIFSYPDTTEGSDWHLHEFVLKETKTKQNINQKTLAFEHFTHYCLSHLVQWWTLLNSADLHFHSWLQLCEKAKTSALVFLQILHLILM